MSVSAAPVILSISGGRSAVAQHARRRIKRLTEELAQLIKRVIKIEFEILQGQKGSLETEVIQEQEATPGSAPGGRRGEEIRADDEHVIWPFTGEYWRDELGYYRVKIANKCQRSAPEGAPAQEGGATPAEGGGNPSPEAGPGPTP